MSEPCDCGQTVQPERKHLSPDGLVCTEHRWECDHCVLGSCVWPECDPSVIDMSDLPRAAKEAAVAPMCAACHHPIQLVGELNTSPYWRCTENCRCLILGCVPASQKYGTKP